MSVDFAVDTINTFRYDLAWTDKTKIIRKHKDRFALIIPFQPGEQMALQKVVDDVDEGITAPKVLANDTRINKTGAYMNQKWYLLYRTPDVPSSSSPVECILAPDGTVSYSFGTGTTPKTVYPSDLDSSTYYFWMLEDNESGTVWLPGGHSGFTRVLGNSYEDGKLVGLRLHKEKYPGTDDDRIAVTGYFQESGTVKMANLMNVGTLFEYLRFTVSRAIRFSASNMNSDLLGIDGLPSMSWAASDAPATLKKHGDFDLTDSRIVKVIQCPYCPITLDTAQTAQGEVIRIPEGWSINAANELRLDDRTQDFLTTIYSADMQDLKATVPAMGYWEDYEQMPRNDYFEPKILNSAFTTNKLVYDSFSTEIPYERFRGTTSNPRLTITYKQSNALSSDLGFKWDTIGVYSSQVGDYSKYLISTRNNESVIYTNEYLNYQRVGSNWDRKNAITSNVTSWLNTGLSIAGAVIGAIAAPSTGGLSGIAAVSLGIKAGAGILGSVQSSISLANDQARKQEELRSQAAQVSGANDLNLLNWYNGNKAHLMKYSPTETAAEALYDLFYYCGYAHNVQEKPEFSTRYWFDYIQCEADFEGSDLFSEYTDDIKARYELGVTVFHHNRAGWDWRQQYENWERGFLD